MAEIAPTYPGLIPFRQGDQLQGMKHAKHEIYGRQPKVYAHLYACTVDTYYIDI